MHALAIVTLTLSGLACLLFGSDVLDRRLTMRSSALLESLDPLGGADDPAHTDAPIDVAADAGPAPALATAAAGAGAHSSALRPVAPCRHCRGRSTATSTSHLRSPGPLRVPVSR